MTAGHRRQVAKPSGQAARLLLLCLPLAAGCFNLDLPNVPATPPAPSLTVVTPKPGDTISLAGQVSVSAASVNGISNVRVLCGAADAGTRTVFSWAAPPYLALVNFGTCQDLTLPNPDGGFPVLPITVRALSDAGATQDVSLEVFLNAVAPHLSVQYAPSAQPKSPFSVQVNSDAALRSFPSVTLDNLPADSVTALKTSPDGGSYLAFFSSTPGLGTDNGPPYTPGVPVPIEVLTDTDRAVRLTVSATALNGNTTVEDLSVELTRVVWDRYIPGQPASNSATDWAAQPVAYAGGLVLPLATAAPASSASNWLPGRLESADGTFDGFDGTVLPSGPGAGYLAVGLNAQGATLFVQPQGRFSALALAPPPPLRTPLPTLARVVGVPAPPLTAVDTLLCLQDGASVCSATIIESLACLDPSLATVSAASAITSTGPPSPGVVAGAGGRYLSPNVAVCGSSWNLVDLVQGTVSFGPLQDPNLPGNCNIAGISKLLAVGDGTFVVELSSNCIAGAVLPPEISILRVGANSAILGAYTSPLGTPSGVAREVAGVLADGRLVTLRNAPPFTVFELWSLNSATPDVQTPIAGLFDAADFSLGSVLAQSSYAASDGSFAVLLSGGTFGVSLAAFGPNLQPLWLYLYPRLTAAGSARLVSAPSLSDVYLVDQINNRAVSLRVTPQPQAADAGTPDGGPPPSPSPGIYITQTNAVLVFAANATGNTAPLRTITGSLTGLNVPIGLAQDSQGNLYVANRSGSTVTVYAPLATGNVAPLRTLTAPTMLAPQGVAVGVGDDVYVSTCPTCNSTPGGVTAVFHFPAGGTTSDYSIQGGATMLTTAGSLALGPATGSGQPVYVANSFGGNLVTFAAGASGNATPTASFTPLGNNVQSLAYASNTFFVGTPGVGVALYPSDATGEPEPFSELVPLSFTYPGGVAVDTTVTPPTVYLVDYEASEVFIIQTSGVLPNLTLQSSPTLGGTATALSAPLGILVVK
jgi:hypothetical protein